MTKMVESQTVIKISRFKQRFEFKRLIGQGSFGNVAHAYEIDTKREVAIKYVSKKGLNLNYIANEIKLHSLIKSPNIADFYYSEDLCDTIAIVLEYLPSVPAQTINPLMVFKNLLDAVDYLHQHHIVHRDIKLENISIGTNDSVKLFDFGFSKFFNQNEEFDDYPVSNLAFPPEMIRRRPYNAIEFDIWCTVLTFYRLLTFQDKIDFNIVQSDLLRNFFQRAFNNNPTRRFSTCEIYSYFGWQRSKYAFKSTLFIDIIISKQMEKFGFTEDEINLNVNKRERKEFYIYRLLEQRIYDEESIYCRSKYVVDNIFNTFNTEQDRFVDLSHIERRTRLYMSQYEERMNNFFFYVFSCQFIKLKEVVRIPWFINDKFYALPTILRKLDLNISIKNNRISVVSYSGLINYLITLKRSKNNSFLEIERIGKTGVRNTFNFTAKMIVKIKQML